MGQEVKEMKKRILLFSAVCAAACALSGCNLFGNNSNDEYAAINAMLAADYSCIKISITNDFTDEDITLKSEYTVKYSQSEINIQYSVQRFSEISLEKPNEGPVTTYEGTAKIVDGVISGGEEVGLTASIASLSITFKKDYLENVDMTGMYIQADVKDASGFLGTDISCTDMKVNAEFFTCFENMTISYKQSGRSVKYEYVFTR